MSRAEDHALGLELQLIELVEQQTRARLQHREADVNAAQQEIDALQEELARTEDGSAEGLTRPAFRRAAQAGGRPTG